MHRPAAHPAQFPATHRNLVPSLVFDEIESLLALRSTESRVSQMKSNFSSLLVGVFVLVLSLVTPALAALGGDVSSVHLDQAQMKGTLKTTKAEAYTVHEIKIPGNTIVKEYVSAAGKVFAVSWRGQFIPNMQQLLGTYFDQFAQAAKAQRESHVGHRPLNIQQPGLVVQSGGHMRGYIGKAYAPNMVPQGVSPDALQ